MVVARRSDCNSQQILVFVYRFDNGCQEELELEIVLGILAGVEKVFTRVGTDGPVVVLAGAVDAGKWLFMQQAYQTVLLGGFLHNLHCQLVVIGCNIGGGEDWRQLML